MAKYVDGFVITIPKNKVKAYQKISKAASKVWKKYGALDYYEAVGDDLKVPFGRPFPKLTKVKSNETVIFAWIVYKSKKARDIANEKIHRDPFMQKYGPDDMPFDMKNMSYGGFKVIVEG